MFCPECKQKLILTGMGCNDVYIYRCPECIKIWEIKEGEKSENNNR